jgi:hypothetical protein
VVVVHHQNLSGYGRGDDGMTLFYEGRRRGGDYASYARLHNVRQVDRRRRAATVLSASASGIIVLEEEDDGHSGLG